MIFLSLFSWLALSLKPIYLVAGFEQSHVYGTVTEPSLYPECPENVTRISINANTEFINQYPNCVAKLLRVQLNTTTGKVEQLPGMITDSSPIGSSSYLSGTFSNIINKATEKGYVDEQNLFSVGYNYLLHPVTSYDVYDKLKNKIEEVYTKTKEKAVFISFSQGTSFISIFVSNFSDPLWVKKYIDSIVFLAPAFAGWSDFNQLFDQTLSPFPTNDEMKNSIMRMPGLHMMLPNYEVFGDKTIIYNMNEDFDQHNASYSFDFLKKFNKVDSDAESIFKAGAEKYLKVAIPEPPVPSLIVYNDNVLKKTRYSVYQHQNQKVVSMYDGTSDGTVTSDGAEYACGHWSSVKCKNLHDSTNHDGFLTSDTVAQYAFDFIDSNKEVKEDPKIGLFLASGFQGSPLYATVTDASKATMCPSNLKHSLFYTTFATSSKLIDDTTNYWLSDECIAMLTRVELDSSENFVTYAPGIHLESSRFGEYDHLLSYTKIIERAYQEGYTHYKDLFGVGYNYMLHPLMSNEVYEELKTNIEKYYEKTGKKSVVTGHSQGTSFVQIFITDYVTKEWAQKYIAGVIFYAPAFAGWGTYDRLVSSNYGSGFPDSKPEMKISTMRMPGLHIMMPNEGVYGNKTVINNYPTEGAKANASMAADCLMHIGRMDETAYKIFKLTNKYRVPPLPEPPVPSLVIYNSGKSNNNGYNFDQSKDTISGSRLLGTGDGTVADDGPVYACNNWKNVQCYDYKRTDIDHSNIQTQKVTLDLTFDFINNVNKYNPIQNERVEYYKGVTGDFTNATYVDERKVENTEFTATVNSGEKSAYPLSNAFNGHNNQFWISEKPNTDKFHNSIYINFNKNMTLEALLFDSAYGTKGTTRNYYGFPTQLKVYASFGDNPYQLNTVFIGTPTYPSAKFQFVFPEPVTCDKLILEIVDLLPDNWQSDGNRNAVISITFVKHYPKLQKFIPIEGKYLDSNYINQYKVLPTMISSSSCNGGEKSGYPFSQAFNGVTNKFYVSNTDNEPNFHNTITVNFANKLKLDGFIYYGAYTTNSATKVRTFCGFPIQLKVYASLGDQSYELIATYIGSTKDTDTNFQFIFPSPVFCDKIQIEFVEITPDTWQSSGALRPVVSINFIQALPYDELTFHPYEGNYANNDFVSKHRFDPSSFVYSSNGGESSNYPLSNAFDLATNNYHISGTENSETFHNKYYINFTNVVSVDGFIYYSAYVSDQTTKARSFCGFPIKLKVYASVGNQPYEPIALFTGTTKDTDTNFQFIFSTPVRCDKLMLEFVDVTPEVWQSGGAKKPIVNIYIIQYFTHEELTFIPYEGNYTDTNYVNLRRQDSSKITVTSNGGEKSDYPLTNVFNGVTNNFYISGTPNSDNFHNTIFVNFNKKVTLEGFINYGAYITDKTTKVRTFCGLPIKTNVYTSINDEPYELIAVFTGKTKDADTNFQYIFSKPIVCDKIQLEIVELTPDNWQSGGVLNPVLCFDFIYYYDHNFNLVNFLPYTGNYADQNYVNQNRIDPSSFVYSSNGGESSNYPLSNAFDLTTNNYHISGTENSETFHNKYYINFTNVVSVDGFIYYSAYTTDQTTKDRNFCGFPIESKIYYSVNNGPYIPSTIFIGQTAKTNTNFQFVFSSPIVCDKLLIEMVDVLPEVWQSKGVKKPIVNNIFIQKEVPAQTQAPFVSSTPEPTPKASPTSLPLEFICIENKHCEVDGEEFKPVRLDISNSHYIDIENLNDNGGAIRVGNSELELNEVEFIRCSTTIGGGGGIYINNDIKMNNKVTLHNLNFDSCEALYGGAVCIFSNVDESVDIFGCTFIGNKATSSESTTGSILSGGNAIFVCAQNVMIKRNKFKNNEGDGTLKLLNYFDASNQLKMMQSSIHDNNKNNYVSVSNCRFEMNEKSKYSIFYVGGNDGVKPVLSECNFTGVLNDGASFIDGKLLSKDSIKLQVKSCKFAYDLNKAINLNNDYLKIDIKEQEFNFSETTNEAKRNNNNLGNWKLIVAIVLPVAAVLLITAVILSIVILKKRSKLVYNEDEMPVEIQDQLLI